MASLAEKILSISRTNPIEQMGNLAQRILGRKIKINNQPTQQKPQIDNEAFLNDFINKVHAQESSSGTDRRNRKYDYGDYGWHYGFTNTLAKDIKEKQKIGDKRYKDISLDFSTPESARQSALSYARFRQNIYGDRGDVVKTIKDATELYKWWNDRSGNQQALEAFKKR